MSNTKPAAPTFKPHEADYVRNAVQSFLNEFGSRELAARAADDVAYSYRRDGGARRNRLAEMHEECARQLRA